MNASEVRGRTSGTFEVGTQSQRRLSIVLDWSRLLGFDQAFAADPRDASRTPHLRLARVGTKVGSKPNESKPSA